MCTSSIAIVVPTLDAALDWPHLSRLGEGGVPPEHVLIVDSSSSDGTPELARTAGFRVHTIARDQFNHGGTRQLAAELLPGAEILVLLTQDTVLLDGDAIKKLLNAFTDPNVAAAFGRQLPRSKATPIEAHARLYNYPGRSESRTLASRERFGIKSIFLSNSFAAYRRDALMSVGGFPKHVIFGEDTVTAAKLLLAGWKIAYVAEAQVHHSHSYTWLQEFRRYFDIGVLHSRESWLIEEFGSAGNEGSRFVRSQLNYLWPRHVELLPSALIRTALKFGGYRLGRIERKLSLKWKQRLSMNRQFWRQQ